MSARQIANPFPNPLYPDATMLKDPGATAEHHPRRALDQRFAAMTTSISSRMASTAASGVTTTCNGSAARTITSSTISGTSRSNRTTSTRTTCSTSTIPPRLLRSCQRRHAVLAAIHAVQRARSAPNARDAAVFSCTAEFQTALMYLNYKPRPLDNISYRAEFVDDKEGQRTGIKTRYIETGIGWQHWFSPQIEIRPEVSYYKSLDAFAFNGNSNLGIATDQEVRHHRRVGHHHSLLMQGTLAA